VLRPDFRKIVIGNWDNYLAQGGELAVNKPLHKKNPGLGDKMVMRGPVLLIEDIDAESIAEGEKITLIDWGNFKVTETSWDSGEIRLRADYLPDDQNYKGTKKFTWLVDDTAASLTPLKLQYDSVLITKPKLEEADSLEQVASTDSRKVYEAWGDHNLKSVAKGTTLQLERKGFFIVDQEYRAAKETGTLGTEVPREEQAVVLINIPSGRVVRKY